MTDAQWGKVLRYIDAQLESALTVADIAAVAGYSAFHFNRMFAARYGASVMAYLRTRRLQHAAARVTQGERILDIALRYGFGSHEAFTRAFRRLYGVPPLRFRALQLGPYAVPPHIGVIKTSKGENDMTPRKIQFSDRTLIGYRIQTQPGSAEIPAFWEAVMGDERWQRLMGKMAGDGLNYGLCIHPEGMPDGRMDYMIAFDYDGESPVDADMELFPLKAASYRVFTVPKEGEEVPADIRRCWSYIYSEWFPASGVVCDGYAPDFEVYHENGGVDIYIPVMEG